MSDRQIAAIIIVAVLILIAIFTIFSPDRVRGHYETRHDPGGMRWGMGMDGKMGMHYHFPSTSRVWVCDEYGTSPYDRWKARRR